MSANPIELVGGLTTTANVPKADVVAWAKARVPQVMANATEIRNTTLASQLVIILNATGQTYRLDVADTTTLDDGVNCIVSSDGKRFKALGVFSSLAVPHQFLTGVDVSGNPTRAQPSLADLSDSISGKDTDVALTANSDTVIPTQKAVKSYVDTHVGAVASGLMSTIATLNATTPSGSAVWVASYSTSTPFAPALWCKLAATPSPVKAWHTQDFSGNYWQLTMARVSPEMFGAYGDGAHDDATAIASWTSYILAFKAEGFVPNYYDTSGQIVLPDGTDPGGFIVRGIGRDKCGFFYTGTGDFVSGPATGSNRHSGVVLEHFFIDGNNTGKHAINILNALDCDYQFLHIKRFTDDTILFDGTVSYGALGCNVKRCKTSPTTSNAALQAGNPAAVNVKLGNYVAIERNYFSGYIDGTNFLQNLVKNSGDSTSCDRNIYESCNHCITTSGSSFASVHDHPIGSSIQTSIWFTVTANQATGFILPRDATVANFDLTGVTLPGEVTLILENNGLQRNLQTYTSPVATLDVRGIDYINLNFTGTITAFANVVIGKLYTFYAHGSTTLSRTNAIYAIGGANLTPANGTSAIFVGETATQMRQLTAFAAAT